MKQIETPASHYQALFESNHDAILLTTPDGVILAANPAAQRMFGRSIDELQAAGRSGIVMDRHGEQAAHLGGNGRPYAGQVRCLRASGEEFPAFASARTVDGGTPGQDLVMLTIHDLSQMRRLLERRRVTEERLRTTFEQAPVGIVEEDLEGHFLLVNRSFASMLRYTRERLQKMSLYDLLHPDDLPAVQSARERLHRGEISYYTMETRYRRRDGVYLWVNASVTLAADRMGTSHTIAIVEDITSRRRAREDLEEANRRSYYLATHDTLTGLINRQHFNECLHEALAHARREGFTVGLHLLDLDRFKWINDTFGHQVGDALLKQVGARLKAAVRETDIVARFAGDEFVIVQTHVDDRDSASMLASKVINDLARPYSFDEGEAVTGASAGIAFFPGDAQNEADLLKFADLALYRSKRDGRGRYSFYEGAMSDSAAQVQAFERDLVGALHRDELCLYYQPQFELLTGRIAGVEALLRWRSKDRGFIPASDFLVHAKDANVNLRLAEWSLRTACLAHRSWIETNGAVPLTVNVWARQFSHPAFAQTVEDVLTETGLPPNLLFIEMRERVLLDEKTGDDVIRRLKALGVRVSLDGFGTDVTALSFLQNHSIDAVKLANALVEFVPGREAESAIATAILRVANTFGLRSCASGVERLSQVRFLKANGCTVAQGHYFAPPMPMEALRMLHAPCTHAPMRARF